MRGVPCRCRLSALHEMNCVTGVMMISRRRTADFAKQKPPESLQFDVAEIRFAGIEAFLF
jgi:hypothetical protein